jgi:uncharacterized phage protein (TIGR02220 family)
MDFLLFIKDLRLKNKVYCEIWLNILIQYNNEDSKIINIYPAPEVNQRTFYRIIDYGILSFNQYIKNYKIEKQRSKIVINKLQKNTPEKLVKIPKPKKIHTTFKQISIKPEIIEVNIYTEIIDYLNKCSGKEFKPNMKVAKDKINLRLQEGYVLEDFKKVIEIKSKKWLGTKWEDYLTPTTLFGDKFGIYLNEKTTSTKTKLEKNYDTIVESAKLGWDNQKTNP